MVAKKRWRGPSAVILLVAVISLALPPLVAQTENSESAGRQKSLASPNGSNTMSVPLVAPLFIEDAQKTSVITITLVQNRLLLENPLLISKNIRSLSRA